MLGGSLWIVTLGLLGGCTNVPPLPPRAVALNQDGAAALAAGDLGTAEARLALAIEYSPRFTEAWVNLGYVEMGRGNLELAKKHFRKARELNPDLPAPHHALGLLADKRDSQIEAEAYYRAALKVDPGFTAARANLARRLFQRGAFEDAREQFLRLTEITPDAVAGWEGLAECLLRLGRDAEADAVIARGRAKLGEASPLLLLVARQLLRRAAYRDAELILLPLTRDADTKRAGAAWAWTAVARVASAQCAGARDAVHEAQRIDAHDAVAAYALEAIEGARTPCR